jgi:hypothetical protein
MITQAVEWSCLGLSDFQVDYIAVVDHMYSECYLGPLLMVPKLLRKSWSVRIWMLYTLNSHRSLAVGSTF